MVRGPPGAPGEAKKSKNNDIFFGQKILVTSRIFGHFDSLISMIWGHHWIENSRKWGGFWRSQGPAIGSQASFKILSGTAVNCTLRRKVQFYCSGAQNFENLHGSLSQPIFDRNDERSSKFQYRRWGLCCHISKITQSRWKDFGWKMENHGA